MRPVGCGVMDRGEQDRRGNWDGWHVAEKLGNEISKVWPVVICRDPWDGRGVWEDERECDDTGDGSVCGRLMDMRHQVRPRTTGVSRILDSETG